MDIICRFEYHLLIPPLWLILLCHAPKYLVSQGSIGGPFPPNSSPSPVRSWAHLSPVYHPCVEDSQFRILRFHPCLLDISSWKSHQGHKPASAPSLFPVVLVTWIALSSTRDPDQETGALLLQTFPFFSPLIPWLCHLFALNSITSAPLLFLHTSILWLHQHAGPPHHALRSAWNAFFIPSPSPPRLPQMD